MLIMDGNNDSDDDNDISDVVVDYADSNDDDDGSSVCSDGVSSVSGDGVCVAVAESIRCPSYQERVRREKKTIYRCVDVCIGWPRNITLARDRVSARGIYE